MTDWKAVCDEAEAAKPTFYKATTLQAASFYDNKTTWKVGRITRHPKPNLDKGLCSNGVLHASDAPGESLVGGRWPCRLFIVEPRGETIHEGHKRGCSAWKVVEEIEAWRALGPNGQAAAELIEQARTITSKQAGELAAAAGVAVDAGWAAAVDAARDAAWDAARGAWDAASGAASLVVRDLLTPQQFHLLAGPWEKVMGEL